MRVDDKQLAMKNWGIINQCGTVACAAGHCGLDPWFNKQGLKLIPMDITDDIKEGLVSEEESGLGDFANDVDVSDFFGYVGTENIFYNTDQRTVGKVVQECKAHIKYLNKEKIRLAKERLERLQEVQDEINSEYDEYEREIG